MSVTIRCISIDGQGYDMSSMVRAEVDGVIVYTAPDPAPPMPFKVGDFVRVKRSVNRDGSEEGPRARTAGKVIQVSSSDCIVEFPGFIKGWGTGGHCRIYSLLQRADNLLGYRPGKHEAISNIRLIKS